MPVPTWPAFTFFSFRLVNPDSFVFTSWSLTACEAVSDHLLLHVC
jgi:hypothetical protein